MEVQQTYGDQVTFIGMPGLATADSIEAFVEENDVDGLPHILDESGALWDAFGVTQQRTYIYVNDDGSTRVATYGQLEADVQELIAS